jgi:hypothetical protein
VIRLPTNRVVQEKVGYLLSRPVGRPPLEVRRYYASFAYQAGSWNKPRRVVAKVEWHPGELYPRVGFIVTNLARPAERIVAFYNQRGPSGRFQAIRLPQVRPAVRRDATARLHPGGLCSGSWPVTSMSDLQMPNGCAG